MRFHVDGICKGKIFKRTIATSAVSNRLVIWPKRKTTTKKHRKTVDVTDVTGNGATGTRPQLHQHWLVVEMTAH